jgi:triacylglycerol esterase/lipase EstA (alpha/beta hydrolase family)
LRRHFERLGESVVVHQAQTLPTASIRQRAARVREELIRIAQQDDGAIHLVGHSTGGLDARLAIAPTAALPVDEEFRAYDRVKSVVTISSPHYGTPLASFVGGAMGKPLIQALAIMMVVALNRGRLPLRYALKLGHLWSRVDDIVGLDDTVLDQVYRDVLGDFSEDRRRQIVEFI